MAKDEVRKKFVSTRLSPPEYAEIESAVAKSDSQKTEWLRDAAMEEAENPMPWVTCKFTFEELQNQTVEARFTAPNQADTWLGKFLVRKHRSGKLRIEVCIRIHASLEKAVIRRYWVRQYGADKIERHPYPQIAAFRLIA